MASSSLNRLQLAPDLSICRILNGMWQVSGGHGRIDPTAAIKSMFDYVDAGFTTWDLADIYGPAEDLMGEFRRQFAAARGAEALEKSASFHQVGSSADADDEETGGRQYQQIVEKNGESNRSICSNSTGGTTVTTVISTLYDISLNFRKKEKSNTWP